MSDIRIPLELVRRRLNEFIRAAEPRAEDWVILSNLVDPAGKPVERARDRLVMYLAGIEKETAVSTYTAAVPSGDTGYAIVPPPVYVRLHVLVIANFYENNYTEGLGVISRALQFFQQNPSFTADNLPGLPVEVDRLTWNLSNLDPVNLSYVMGLAGVKYLPSLYYQVRLLPFQSSAPQRQEPAVRGTQTPADPGAPASDGEHWAQAGVAGAPPQPRAEAR